MRLVEMLIPKEKREAVEEVLEGEDIDYTLVEEGGHREPSVVITFPLPAPAIESVLDEIRDTGIDEDSYTVIVEAETVTISSRTSNNDTPRTPRASLARKCRPKRRTSPLASARTSS